VSAPTAQQQAWRERIKLAIQTAQDSQGDLLYVIPPGVAGMYADAIMRALTQADYPFAPVPEGSDREPQMEDGPDFHAEHSAWRNRKPEGSDQ
jgi:hypothetical protein